MTETTVNKKLGITFTASQAWSFGRMAVGAVLIAVAGYATWRDLDDGIKVNAGEVDDLRRFTIAQNLIQDEETSDLSESVDENEERIEELERDNIERDGNIERAVETLNLKQEAIKDSLERIEELLERQTR